MMARDRHAPIVEAIARGDVAAAVRWSSSTWPPPREQYAPHD